MPSKCSPPKSTTVRAYWRAAPRKKRSGLRRATTYFVAENAAGRECGHEHRSWTAAHACAARLNRKAARNQGRRAATWLTEKKKAR